MTEESDAKKALAQVNQEIQAEDRRLQGTVKMYFVPITFAIGTLLGYIAGHIRP